MIKREGKLFTFGAVLSIVFPALGFILFLIKPVPRRLKDGIEHGALTGILVYFTLLIIFSAVLLICLPFMV